MDATKRPLTIPPEISNYAEEHGIFDLYKVLICLLLDIVEIIIPEIWLANSNPTIPNPNRNPTKLAARLAVWPCVWILFPAYGTVNTQNTSGP